MVAINLASRVNQPQFGSLLGSGSTYHRRNVPGQYWMEKPSPWSLFTSRDGPFWAAERKITGNAVAYLIALYRGRRVALGGEEYSIKH